MKTRDKIVPITINDRGCWLWMAKCNWAGYAMTRTPKNRKELRVSRLILAAKLMRSLKENALHTCDTPSCINPDHLFEGTIGDNNRDKTAKGRHHNSKKTHCKWGHAFTTKNTY